MDPSTRHVESRKIEEGWGETATKRSGVEIPSGQGNKSGGRVALVPVETKPHHEIGKPNNWHWTGT